MFDPYIVQVSYIGFITEWNVAFMPFGKCHCTHLAFKRNDRKSSIACGYRNSSPKHTTWYCIHSNTPVLNIFTTMHHLQKYLRSQPYAFFCFPRRISFKIWSTTLMWIITIQLRLFKVTYRAQNGFLGQNQLKTKKQVTYACLHCFSPCCRIYRHYFH